MSPVTLQRLRLRYQLGSNLVAKLPFIFFRSEGGDADSKTYSSVTAPAVPAEHPSPPAPHLSPHSDSPEGTVLSTGAHAKRGALHCRARRPEHPCVSSYVTAKPRCQDILLSHSPARHGLFPHQPKRVTSESPCLWALGWRYRMKERSHTDNAPRDPRHLPGVDQQHPHLATPLEADRV